MSASIDSKAARAAVEIYARICHARLEAFEDAAVAVARIHPECKSFPELFDMLWMEAIKPGVTWP